MPDQATLDILIDIRSRLEELTKTSDQTRELTEGLKELRQQGGEIGNMFKTGLGIDLARRSLDLITSTVREFVVEAFKMAGQIKDVAQNLEVSREAYQVLGVTLADAGGDVGLLTQSIAANNRSLVEARSQVGPAAAAYRDLGLNLAELEALPVEKRFEKYAVAIMESKDQTKAFSDAGAILGTRNLPTLLGALKSLASEGYDKLAASAKDAGLVMSDETIDRLEAAGKSLEKFKKAAIIATGEAAGDLLGSDPEFLTNVMSGASLLAQKFGELGRGLGYAAAAVALNRSALRDYGEAQADAAAADNLRTAAEWEAEARRREATQKALDDLNARRDAELAVNQSILYRQAIESSPLSTEIEKREQVLGAIQGEIRAREQLYELIRTSPVDTAKGETDQAHLLALTKMSLEISALQDRSRLLGGGDRKTAALLSQERYNSIERPRDNPDYLTMGQGVGAGARDYFSELGSQGEQVAAALKGTIGTAVSSISDGIYGWISGAETFGQALQNMASTILDQILKTIIEMGVQWLVQQALIQTGIISIKATTSAVRMADTAETIQAEATKTPALATNAGLASVSSFGLAPVLGIAALVAAIAVIGSLAFREQGGPVEAGRAYVVGEKRPEIFVPSTPGTIIPSLDAFAVPSTPIASSVASSPSLGVSTGGAGAGNSGGRNNTLTIVTAGTQSEVRRHLESAAGQSQVLDISQRGRLDLGIAG